MTNMENPTSDLVKELREALYYPFLCRRAADHIEALEAQLAKWERKAALKEMQDIVEDLEAHRIEALEEQNKRLSKIIAALMPHLVEHYFICGEGGEKDDNGLPDAISICPAYGADWTATYKRVKHD
jgi:hypothetical protein